MERTEESYCVAGSVLLSKIEALESLFDRGAVQGLRVRVGTKLPRTINELEWYPYEMLETILADMQMHAFGGRVELLSRVGAETARLLLESTYRPLAAGGDWRRFIETAPRLHSRYYNQGEMQVNFTAGDVCRIDLVGAPRYAPGDLHVAGGFYSGSATILGSSATTYRLEVDARGAHFEIC